MMMGASLEGLHELKRISVQPQNYPHSAGLTAAAGAAASSISAYPAVETSGPRVQTYGAEQYRCAHNSDFLS